MQARLASSSFVLGATYLGRTTRALYLSPVDIWRLHYLREQCAVGSAGFMQSDRAGNPGRALPICAHSKGYIAAWTHLEASPSPFGRPEGSARDQRHELDCTVRNPLSCAQLKRLDRLLSCKVRSEGVFISETRAATL